MRWLVALATVATPAVVYASTGGDAPATFAASLVSLAVQTYVATRIGSLERRVSQLERLP